MTQQTPKRQTLLFHEEKKHSVLYKGIDADPQNYIVKSIYIDKSALQKNPDGTWPAKHTLRLEPFVEG